MTIRPRVGIAGIEFVRDVPGKEEKLVECVSLEVCEYLVNLGLQIGNGGMSIMPVKREHVLTILRQEAGK